MGNSSCRLALKLNDPPSTPHRAGEFIHGRVYLSVTSAAPLATFQGIHLILEGWEHTSLATLDHWASPTVGADFRIRHSHARLHEISFERSTKTIVRLDIPIVNYDGALRAGQYEYPFRFRLPVDLPSTMVYHPPDPGSDGLAEVCYTLMATITYRHIHGGGNGNNSPFLSSLKNRSQEDSIPVIIHGNPGRLLQAGKPVVVPFETHPIHTCCCFREGTIRMRYDTSTDVASPGATLSVHVQGQNHSTVRVQKLAVRMVEDIHFRSGQGQLQKSMSRTLGQQTLMVGSCPCWMPKRRAHRTRSNIHLYESTDTDPSMSLDEFNVLSVVVPMDARDSYNGHLIQVQHTCIVTALTECGWFVTSPESSFPIRIMKPSTAGMGQYTTESRITGTPLLHAELVLPSDWNPTITDDIVVVPEASVVMFDEELHTGVHGTYHGDRYSSVDCRGINESDSRESYQTSSATVASSTSSSSKLDAVPAKAIASLEQLQHLVATRPETLDSFLRDDMKWRNLVENLSPRQLSDTIRSVPARDASKVARVLARTMDMRLTTRHVMACLYAIDSGTIRMEVVLVLLPWVSDLQEHISLLEQELTPEELRQFRENRFESVVSGVV